MIHDPAFYALVAGFGLIGWAVLIRARAISPWVFDRECRLFRRLILAGIAIVALTTAVKVLAA